MTRKKNRAQELRKHNAAKPLDDVCLSGLHPDGPYPTSLFLSTAGICILENGDADTIMTAKLARCT